MATKKQMPMLVDERLVRAMAHWIRIYAMDVLRSRTASPKQLSLELDEDVSRIAYHVRELLKVGIIELVETKPKRGATEHFYRATRRPFFPDDQWKHVPTKERPGITMAILQLISQDLTKAVLAGTLDTTDDNHLSRTPLSLDKEGWGEVVSLLSDTLDDLIAIQERSSSRVAKTGEKAVMTKVAIMHFKSPTPVADTS